MHSMQDFNEDFKIILPNHVCKKLYLCKQLLKAFVQYICGLQESKKHLCSEDMTFLPLLWTSKGFCYYKGQIWLDKFVTFKTTAARWYLLV